MPSGAVARAAAAGPNGSMAAGLTQAGFTVPTSRVM